MSRGSRRILIPYGYSDLNAWQSPDISVFDEREKFKYMQRKLAVEMYASDRSSSEIKERTGKSDSEVRRLVKRCLAQADDGAIAGFRALLPRIRVENYTRRAPIERIIGSSSAGCSGALTQLFERFPEIEAEIQELFFKDGLKRKIHEARVSVRVMHKTLLMALRGKGLTDYDWPFNTVNQGYKSLAAYLLRLQAENVGRSAFARSGKEAAQRNTIGNGHRSILPNLRAFSFAQLDFHKVDAASVIVIRNEFGGELLVPISRWHIGFLVEEKYGGILGAFVALERNPSGDSTLEVIDSALRPQEFKNGDPRCQFLNDGKMLIGHFIPELSYQCFSVLKVDNAWSNAAHEVVNNIMDTIGCAVNFGPVRAWWRRGLIESIFGELEKRGLQRLPSTYGSGPTDTRKDRPNEKAVKFRISLTELVSVVYGCVREHNLRKTEKLQWTRPVDAIRNALEHTASGLFPQPVPLSAQADLRLLMHIEEVTVRGNVSKGERPYFTSDRCTYTNEKLAKAYWLIGKKIVIHVDRRKCRNVFATIKETGEHLGWMIAEPKWANSECSWRDRKLINRSGQATANSDEGADPVLDLLARKSERILSRRKKDRHRSSGDALEIARVVFSGVAPPTILSKSEHTSSHEDVPNAGGNADPFGLGEIPAMRPVSREN